MLSDIAVKKILQTPPWGLHYHYIIPLIPLRMNKVQIIYHFSSKVVYDFQAVYQNTKREFCALS